MTNNMAMPAGFDPTTIPLAPNPSGAPPNFVDPPSLAPTILGTGVLLIFLSAPCVAARFFTSLKNKGKWGIDDYCVGFGFVGVIAYWAIIYSLAIDGWGRHTWDVPLSFLNSSFTDKQFASQILISPVRLAIISAIIVLYLRIFGILRWVRYACYFLWGFTFLIQVQNVAIAIQWYAPRPGEGDMNTLKAMLRAKTTASSAIVNASCSTAVDLGLFIIPFLVVPTLKLSRERKRALNVVFLFGVLTIVAGCVGIAYKTLGVLGKGGDPFWVGMTAIITVYAETFALLIISCVPALSAFYLGTVTKSKFYSSVMSSVVRLTKKQDSSSLASGNSSDPSKHPYPPSSGQDGSHTDHSVKSMTNEKVIVKTSEFELRTTTQMV